jgi:hypothetical protein
MKCSSYGEKDAIHQRRTIVAGPSRVYFTRRCRWIAPLMAGAAAATVEEAMGEVAAATDPDQSHASSDRDTTPGRAVRRRQ